MLLEGSCHCKSVQFQVESPEPYPYQACYCSICRKTAGGGGYAINLGALSETLEVEGRKNIRVYNARLYDRGDSDEIRPARRNATSASCAAAPSGSTILAGRISSIRLPQR